MSGWTPIMFSLIAAIVIVAAIAIISVQTPTSPLLQRPTNLNQAVG